MIIKRYVEPDGLIVTHFGGKHTFKDAVDALKDLSTLNAGNSEIYEIVINNEDIAIEFGKQEISNIAEVVENAFSQFDRGGLAIVAQNSLAFGLSRMLEMSIINDQITIAVFRTELLARQWIAEMRMLHESTELDAMEKEDIATKLRAAGFNPNV